jgi:hypothetical protein
MPIRIHEIARKFGVDNRVVLLKAAELGIAAAKGPTSTLDARTAALLEKEVERQMADVYRTGLQSIALGNFKAFRETQSVPLRPLTLIFGANSSGKSSLIHGLLLARHAFETGELDVTRTEIGGDSVDLGGFRQYVHRRDISQRVEWVATLSAYALQGHALRCAEKSRAAKLTLSFGLPLDNFGQPVAGELPRLISYEMESDDRVILRLSRRADGTFQVDRLDQETLRPIINAVLASVTTSDRIDPGNASAVTKALDKLIPILRFSARKILPDRLTTGDLTGPALEDLIPISKGSRVDELAGAAQVFIPRTIADTIESLNNALLIQLGRIRYLGPLRSFPARHLAFAGDQDRNWLAGGGYAWDLVRRDTELREKVNRWLGSERLQTRYELAVERLFRHSDAESGVEGGLGSIAADMERKMKAASDEDHHFPFDNLWDEQEYTRWLMEGIRKKSAERAVDELILMDRRTNTPVTHRDVGIGISQVLPVLVHAYADKGQIVAIEQPEIHLHPALQAELGDVFIESALGENKNTFLLETHSEHLILRILRRVRETTENKLPKDATPVRPEDVTVVFVEPTPKGSVVREMRVDDRGRLLDPWPGGFFEESFNELF